MLGSILWCRRACIRSMGGLVAHGMVNGNRTAWAWPFLGDEHCVWVFRGTCIIEIYTIHVALH